MMEAACQLTAKGFVGVERCLLYYYHQPKLSKMCTIQAVLDLQSAHTWVQEVGGSLGVRGVGSSVFTIMHGAIACQMIHLGIEPTLQPKSSI